MTFKHIHNVFYKMGHRHKIWYDSRNHTEPSGKPVAVLFTVAYPRLINDYRNVLREVCDFSYELSV